MILPDPPAPALAPPSEDDAFAALQNLEYLAAYGTAPPDEPTRLAVKALKFRQPTDRATLEAYATHRRARSLPLFPTQTAKASRERDTFLANLYTKAPEEFLPKADLDNLNAAAEASGDPENFKKGQLNRTFLSAITGKQLSGEAYALTRDLYARQHLGMTGPVTDAAFHGAMAARHAEDSTASQASLAASSAAFQQALIGEPVDRAAFAATVAALPERHRPTAQAGLHEAVREANAARRRNMPAVSRVAGTVESIIATPGDAVTGATRETSLRRLIVDMAAALPDDPAERDIALAMLGKELSKLPEDDRAGLTRIWDGLQRGLNATVEGVKGLGWEAVASAAGVSEYVPDKVVRRPGFGQETINDRTKVAQLKGLIQGDALDLRKASDSFLLKASIAAAPSVPYTFLAISPYGFGVMAASLAGQSAQDSRINSPETNANARLSAAIASGVGQAVIETIFTRAALKLATGRIPTLTNLLNRAAIGSLTARGAAGALGAGAAAYGIEFTEEVAQDALDLSLQNAATELSGINANVDWRQFFTDWTPGGGAKADETLLAITPFALIAGGIAGVHQFRNGAYYLKNAALMRAAGITEPQIRSITGAASPEEAQDLLKTSFEEAQQRQAADPKERERLATYREAALADLRASNEALTRAGLPRIAQEWNDTTEEYQTVFLNPADDSRQIFDTEEEALEAWHAEINTQNEADLDALATAAEDGFIEHVMGEGQLAATGVSVQTVQREVSLASEQSAMLADVKAAREAGRRASTAAKRRAAEDALATATTRLANLKARVEIFILDQGLTPEAAADTLKNTFIRGRVTAQKIGDAIVGQTIELFNGRTLSDVVEEFSEANLRNGILDGVVDPEIMLDDIRRYETATGRQVIAKGYAYDPANPLPLTEGFSKLARGYVFSQIRGGQLPETVRKWAEMQALIGSAILSTGSAFAADINVAGDLREAMKAGHLPPRLQRKLADSAGISESDRNYRLQKAMEEQLAAEAMGGFPEIRETLRGRLPHPNTARKNNLPLVGELQRIYDSLIRPTRRKTKDGRTIDRTNEANAYFLPEGQTESLDLVRRSLNEKGFDFATPAEMLDALDASISYNKPQYGTFSGESYSLERTPAGQRNPTVPTNQPGGANIGDGALPGNSVVTPEMDAAYLDAAERGDFETSLELVDLLATKLGFKKGPFWHVTQDQRDEMDSKIENEGKWRDESDSKYFQILGPPFAKFKSGDLIHVGDFDAARERALNGWAASSNPYFIRVFLKFKKAIKKDDSDSSQYDERGVNALEKLGFKPKIRPPYGWGGQVSSEEFESLLDAFDEAGVDALWYKNEHEGNGGKSYAVIRPEQIFIADPIVRDEAGNIIPLSRRFDQSTPAASGESMSLSHRSILRLEEAIARKMTQGPEERAAYYEKLRNRLAATVLQLRETKRNLALGQTEAERERNRIRDGLAEARAIIAALPPDARGRVTFPIGDILDADTERGQVNALLRLIDEADSALEKVLLKEYQEAYETLLDLAKPDLRQNKTLRGRLTPEAQRLIALVQEAVVMDEATLAAQIVGAEAAIATIEAETPQTPDEIKDAQQRLIAASQWLHILTTHGALATLDAARTAAAYENLLGIYTTARTTRRILDEAKKAELMAARQEVIDSLPATDQAKHASRVNDDGRIDLIKSFGLSMVSFHQAMEWFFPKSATARKLQDQVRAADRAFTRAKIDARDRFAAFADAAWNITGKAKTWQRNRILADLSTARADWNVQLTEGIGTTEEKLTEAQADAILAGKMKTGWETDRIALISLQQALADFRLQRLKVQREQQEYAALTPEQKKHAKRVYPFSSTVIRFKRITSRGTPGPLLMSDLEVLYILQLWAQEEYQPALDKYGFTEAVVTTLQGKLNPKAEQLGDFLRTEYDAEWDRLNPVYRNRFGMDMPKIRNYAPGQFQHAQAQAGGTMTPAGAAPPVNAMAAGFTKARTHHLARPEKSNAMAAYWSHLEATEYFIAFSDILTDARTVFRTPEVRRRLESAYGTKATALFHQWLDALELDGNFKAADTLAQKTIVANLLNTQSAVGLAYNIGVLFKQAGATMGAMLEMKTTEALHGVAALARDPSGWTAVWNSEAIRQRVAAGMSPEDRQLLAASAESPSAILHALAIGRLPIAYADAVFTTAGAAVAYSHHRAAAAKEGLAPEQAHAHALAVASRIIERTAQPATPQDKSMAELSFGLLGRLLFMFKSDPRQKMAIVGMAAAQYARGDIKAPELFRKFFWGWFVYGIANELMTDAFQAITRDDDDPDRWSWKDYLAGGLAGPLNALPFYGTVFGYAASKILGTKGYSNSLNPLDRAAEDSIRLTRKIAEAFGDGKELTVQNYMTMSQQFAASLAILAGGLDSRLAILPASLRVLRDSWGVLLNTADAALPDSPETVAARIVAETEATEATASKENTRALNALANELAKLPTPARTARLASMDRDTREAVTRRLRKSLMTPSEQALANLSKASRAAAVAKILAALPESARERHLQRLKDLGLAP